jgi:aerobic C4-dicarboxylate transport protein
VIFCTVAHGIAQLNDVRAFGRVGAKTLVYFELVSTLALVIGLVVGVVLHPGLGFPMDRVHADTAQLSRVTEAAAHPEHWWQYFLDVIPTSFLSPFAEGNILQILLIAVLTGFALTRMGDLGHRLNTGLEHLSQVFFANIRMVVRLAPIGAFGAMAYTVGKFGPQVLGNLAVLIATFYVTAFLFVALVLGAIAWGCGYSIFRLIRYLGDELLIVLGASSSEAALPQLMDKLTRLGAPRSIVGLVVPTGYSFNLDGTNIYMTLAVLFLAQATGAHLTPLQMATIIGVAMLTSKGATGVTGAGFIVLAATLQAIPGVPIPVTALAAIFGIDRFMSECRSLTNFIGNGVATLAIARWEGQLDMETLHAELQRKPAPTPPAAPDAAAAATPD